jgi:hypothetical protein
MSAVTEALILMAVTHMCVDIEDDDGALIVGEEFDEALAAVIETPPASLQDASDRLRMLACVGKVYADCTSMGERVRQGIVSVAGWLEAAATGNLVDNLPEVREAA